MTRTLSASVVRNALDHGQSPVPQHGRAVGQRRASNGHVWDSAVPARIAGHDDRDLADPPAPTALGATRPLGVGRVRRSFRQDWKGNRECRQAVTTTAVYCDGTATPAGLQVVVAKTLACATYGKGVAHGHEMVPCPFPPIGAGSPVGGAVGVLPLDLRRWLRGVHPQKGEVLSLPCTEATLWRAVQGATGNSLNRKAPHNEAR